MIKNLTIDQTLKELQLEMEELEILMKEKKIEFFSEKNVIFFPYESVEKYKKKIMELSTLRMKEDEI